MQVPAEQALDCLLPLPRRVVLLGTLTGVQAQQIMKAKSVRARGSTRCAAANRSSSRRACSTGCPASAAAACPLKSGADADRQARVLPS